MASDLRSRRDEDNAGPQRVRHEPTHQGYSPEALMIVSPSNRSVFAALATDTLNDLHSLDPASRVITRTKPT